MKTVVVCIGNPEGGDDAVGPYLAKQLTSHQTNNFIVINTETVPENYTGVIKQHRPDQLIIIDAVNMNLSPGSLRKIPPDKIGSMHISTHGIPLSVFINYLQQYIPDILVLGIQPKTMQGTLSSDVQQAADHLVTLLTQQNTNKIKSL